MTKHKYSYDPACETLAQHFLHEDRDISDAGTKDLAQHIQECIEDWLQLRESVR